MTRIRMLILTCALLPASALAQTPNPVRALRQQIEALQVDHALNLSPQQAQALLPLLQDLKAKVTALKAQRASSQPALVAALTQAVADLKANGAVSPSTSQAVQAARGNGFGTLRQDVAAFWQQAKPIFTAEQLQALKTVKLGAGVVLAPATGGPSAQGHGHRHFARRVAIMRTLLSDDFVTLVETRAG